MRIRYDPEADIRLLVLRGDRQVGAIEESGEVIVIYGEDGEIVGNFDVGRSHTSGGASRHRC
jgi:uncharacterized protein YuzE